MAKPSKKKSRNEPISVSEIYETIQARDFLRELWWDLISDIQEKPTYKRIKGMVSDVINNTMKNFTSKSADANEELKRRTALTEISIMTYTLDTVISEVLYRRYQNEFEDIVKNLIEDLIKNRTKEASNPVAGESVFENIENIFDKEKSKSRGIKKNDHAVSSPKKSQILNSESGVDGFNDAPARKRGRPKKISITEEKAEKVNALANKKRGRPSITPKTNIAKSLNVQIKREEDDQESGAESEISVGNFSIDSVSSVHTSELSSFEDTVSICSDGEGEKKHIPLKVANEMYLRGKLSQIYHIGKKSEKFKLMQSASTSSKDLIPTQKFKPMQKASTSSKNLIKAENSSSNAGCPSRKVLPQRIRKPNSKYNSETMFCDVKDYSSPPGETGSSSSQDEMDRKSPVSPKIQRKRKRSSLDKGIASKSSAPHNVSPTRNNSPSKRIKTNNSPLSKASTKRYDTSDLYKPRAVTGNIIGSRSTAVTLFST